MDLAILREALTQAPFNSGRPTLSRDEAEIRASMVFDDMTAVGIDVVVQAFPVGNDIWVPYYEIPRSDFQKEQGTPDNPVPDSLTAAGSGLNWGDLVRLSKACKVGRTLIPDLWPHRFKDKLLSDHLATIQELLWLSRFRNPKSIEPEPRPFPSCKKGPDWRFRCESQAINLEVKYRPGDWVRHVDGPEYSPARPGLFADAAAKFPCKIEGELNLVALSIIGSIDESVLGAADYFLSSTPTVDAVLIWTDAPKGGPTTTVRPYPSAFVKLFYNDGDFEDRCHIGVIRHLWRNSAERRTITPDEVGSVLAAIVANTR